MRNLAILVFISFIYHSSAIYGQNLAAGNPSLSDAEKICLSAKEIAFSLSYQNSFANKFYNEDRLYNGIKTFKNANSNYAEFKSAYGFTPRISAAVELGYFFNKTINYQDSSRNGFGLGDAAIYLKYRLINSKAAKFILLPSIGIKLPIGVFNQTDNNLPLPIAVQPSSGNFKYMASVYMLKVINEQLSIASNCTYESAQMIESKYFYLKYGDQWMLSFLGNYKFNKNISCNLQFRFENKDKTHMSFNKIIESSGYKIIFITPQLDYCFGNSWQFSVYADLPFYRYYNGIQYASNYSLSIRLLKKMIFY
ncbi:MAG: hypothetical protein HXX18_08645 [Bacteroidetes bacterium]|nr:hypothetical protein [Bacteroidota bacterium]